MEEVELHRLVLRYDKCRIRRSRDLHRLVDSIEGDGQSTPVVTVPGEDQQLVLIDGYLRVEAMRRCGKDTVLAEIWPCEEDQAIVRVLARSQERPWEAIEQAALIEELRGRFQWPLREIARQVGRDLSWVSRRVGLLEALPDKILEALYQGRLSSWTACRILAPLARANSQHALLLGSYLAAEPVATREVAELYGHYQQANARQRQKIVEQPAVFLKALRVRREHHEARALAEGPEGQWLKDCQVLAGILRRLHKAVATVIYPGQQELERRPLLEGFWQAKCLFAAIEETIRRMDDHDLPANQRSHCGPAGPGGPIAPDQPVAEGLPQHGAASAAGQNDLQACWDPPAPASPWTHPSTLSSLPG